MNQIVQGTNDSSILSKTSMVNAGYFKDDYINYFVNKPVKRAPLINIGYFVRACVIDVCLTHFLKSLEGVQVQIISLGAGFDTTFFRLAVKFPNVVYYEIDLPGVIKKKIDIIENCEHLRSTLIESKVKGCVENRCGLRSKKYNLLSHDLSCLVGLENKLKNSGFEFNKTTLVFSECAITYLEEIRSTEIIRWAQRVLPKSMFITFEQINPDDAFGQVMISHFIKIQSPLKSVNKYKNIYQQIQRYLFCGWDWCGGVSAMDILLSIWPEQQLYEQLKREPFDEFEEWHLKCCHYSLVVATKTEFIDTWSKFMIRFDRSSPNGEYIAHQSLKWEDLLDISIQRFGHSLVMINEDSFLLIGGFGCYNKKHTRLSNILHVSLTESIIESIIPEKSDGEQPTWDCMYTTCVKIDHNEFVLYGGRTSPRNPVNYKPWICQIKTDDSKFKKISALQCYDDSKDVVNTSNEPPPRWRHTAVLIAPTKIIIYGGITTGLKVLNDLWMLSICSTIDESKKLSWNLLFSSGNNNTDKIPTPRFSHSAVVHNGTMFISGGLDNSLIALNHLWKYRLNVGWQKLDTVPLLKARYGHSSHITSNNQLILIGGVNLNHDDQPKLTLIYLNTLASIEYEILPNNPESSALMIHNHVSLYHKENHSIYVAGGGGNCFSFGTYLNSNLAKVYLRI